MRFHTSLLLVKPDFSQQEFEFVIEAKKSSICSRFRWYHVSSETKTNLLKALNKACRENNINNECRKIKIVPIPKMRKYLDFITNHRPIALISVLLKVINLMVKEGANKFINDSNILPQGT